MFVLLLTVFVDLVGFGLVFPILPFYAQAYDASVFEITVLVAVYSGMQIVAAPLWGRLSDRFGRKRILITTLAGGAAAYLWFGFADSLMALFLARGLNGAMAGNVAVAQAYMADLTGPRERAQAMGRIGAAFGLGFMIGPALGGLLYDPAGAGGGFALPCLVAAAISGSAALLGLVLLKEPQRRHAGGGERRGLAEALASVRRHGIPGIIVMTFGVTLAFTAMVSIFPLWCQAQLGWGPREVGYAFAWIGLLVALMQGLAIGPVTRRLGSARVLLIGSAALSAGMVTTPFVVGPFSFAANALLMCLGTSFCHPTLTAMVSQRAAAEHQGIAMGITGAVASTGRILSPPVAGVLFQSLGATAPLLAAGVLLWPVVVAAAVMSLRPTRQGSEELR